MVPPHNRNALVFFFFFLLCPSPPSFSAGPPRWLWAFHLASKSPPAGSKDLQLAPGPFQLVRPCMHILTKYPCTSVIIDMQKNRQNLATEFVAKRAVAFRMLKQLNFSTVATDRFIPRLIDSYPWPGHSVSTNYHKTINLI